MINKQNTATFIKLCKNKNITLIAVSKTRTTSEIEQVKNYGIHNFAENYVQEAESKKSAFKDATLHMVGKLQSNKTKQAVTIFDVIHTVTSKKLANKINKYCLDINKFMDVFIQVNIANEPQKNGVTKEEIPELVKSVQQLTNIKLVGLMVIPPNNKPPIKYFKQAQQLINKYNLPYLSMGMSADYEQAIEYGATHIRIGTAIFGKRVK